VSEITNQLTNVVNQIKSLEHSITRLNLQDFEDLISSMNSTLFILSSNLNNLQTNTPTSKSPTLP